MEPPQDAPPPGPPETRTDRIRRLGVAVRAQVDEKAQRVARALLHVRYVSGYLASGFLVSVPIQLVWNVGYGRKSMTEAAVQAAISISYGAVCLLPFFGLIPFSRIDWHAMNVPQFQLFELRATRSATVASAALTVLSLQAHWKWSWIEPEIFWTVFLLMLFAWGRVRLLTLLFPEFYQLREPPPGPPG